MLWWAAGFVFLFALILTLSPAVRERAWDARLRWDHWLGVLIWVVTFAALGLRVGSVTADRDPYLLPCGALLAGWGLLTVWRLDPGLGLRQSLWVAFGGLLFVLGIEKLGDLGILRRHKYVLLAAGLLLTASTLVFGTNPTGAGPRLWLGCCGLFLQPSEPLKLLLVIYLAAYLADRDPSKTSALPLLLPTVLITGLAMLILLVQQDLGTASLILILYAAVVYLATDRVRVPFTAGLGLAAALALGYLSVGLIRVRVDAWLDPWQDPSGNSYHIVQALLAIANGGVFGRGPGIGNPGLVPVATSDSIFVAIAEETGLAGVIALLGLIAVMLGRGMLAALRAPDQFRRLLAAGLTAYLGLQSLMIIGGSLRLLPLTGITLPFVSYGGSSLITSVSALLLLLLCAGDPETKAAALATPRPYRFLIAGLLTALAAASIAEGWWAIGRGTDLLTRTDNARRSIAERQVRRGSLLDRNFREFSVAGGTAGSYERVYRAPPMMSVLGYTHPVYGQSGLESSLDDYLRGLSGHATSTVLWEQLLYGTPPEGIDVRLTLDLDLQAVADSRLGGRAGAVVLLNANSGEILAMASHPFIAPDMLDDEGFSAAVEADAPLLNRATQGSYALGSAITPFLDGAFAGTVPSPEQLQELFLSLGFLDAPAIRAPVAFAAPATVTTQLQVSPLQMALAAAVLSNHGERPAPRIALAVNTEQQGWVILPALGEPVRALSPAVADQTATTLATGTKPYWRVLAAAVQSARPITWAVLGTLPTWQASPLVCVVVLEEPNPKLADSIASAVLSKALGR